MGCGASSQTVEGPPVRGQAKITPSPSVVKRGTSAESTLESRCVRFGADAAGAVSRSDSALPRSPGTVSANDVIAHFGTAESSNSINSRTWRTEDALPVISTEGSEYPTDDHDNAAMTHAGADGAPTGSACTSEMEAFIEYDAFLLHTTPTHHTNTNTPQLPSAPPDKRPTTAKANSGRELALISDDIARGRPLEPLVLEPADHVVESRREALRRRARANGINGSIFQYTAAPTPNRVLRSAARTVRAWFRCNEAIVGGQSQQIFSAVPSAAAEGALSYTESGVTNASTAVPAWGGKGEAAPRGCLHIDIPGATTVADDEGDTAADTAAADTTSRMPLTEATLYLARVAAESSFGGEQLRRPII